MKKLKGVTEVSYKVIMKIKKYSPEILLVSGVIGVVASAIVACRATTKVNEVREELNTRISELKNDHSVEFDDKNECDAVDIKKAMALIYSNAALSYVKLYAPSVILGMVSIGSILASHNIIRKRNLALGAAYAAIDSSFKQYRSNVVERYGDIVDKELKYGLVTEETEKYETDSETGKKTKTKSSSYIADENICSDYAVYFDNKSRNFEGIRDYDLMFLRAQEQFANDKLQSRGHIFLNEVLDDLDLDRSSAGQIVGWTKDGPDGHVNFRILEVERKTEDGETYPAILLDFNVEGDIWSKM